MDVPIANVSMTGIEMCTLLRCVVSYKITEEYHCLHAIVPSNPNKLVKELTKTENKLKSSSKSVTGLRERGQDGPSREGRTPKDKHHKSKGSGAEMAAPIPRKGDKPPRETGMLCALRNKYGGAAKSHTTAHCKRWTGAGKSRPK